MQTKEVKIQVPNGYEIDRENSTFECIKFKPKNIIYKDVCNKLFKELNGYFITSLGETDTFIISQINLHRIVQQIISNLKNC